MNINFEFNKSKIQNLINKNIKGYICVVNANIIVNANSDENYRSIINNSLFNICDGSIIALLYNKIHRKNVSSYPGPDMFIEYIKEKKFTSAFIGSSSELLTSLKKEMTKIDSNIESLSGSFKKLERLITDFEFIDLVEATNRVDWDSSKITKL